MITRQPANLSLSIGTTAAFRVTATTSQPPISYQWRRGSTLLVSATNASLTLTNIQMAHVGAYTVTLRDEGGTIESNAATLASAQKPAMTWSRCGQTSMEMAGRTCSCQPHQVVAPHSATMVGALSIK